MYEEKQKVKWVLKDERKREMGMKEEMLIRRGRRKIGKKREEKQQEEGKNMTIHERMNLKTKRRISSGEWNLNESIKIKHVGFHIGRFHPCHERLCV